MSKTSGFSLSFDQMQELISHIYDASLDQTQWENVLHLLASALHAEQGHMRILNETTKEIHQTHTLNKDQHWMQAYDDYYIHIDHWIDLFCKKNETTLSCTHHLLSDKEQKVTEFYNDFSRPQEIHYGIGGMIKLNTESSCYLTFQRSMQHVAFKQQYLDILNGLAPHIQKAALINQRLNRADLKHNLLNDALNQINSPLCLVNKQGMLLFINELAEQLFERSDGFSIKNNRIVIRSSQKDDELQALITKATFKNRKNLLNQGGAMSYTSPSSHITLSILVSPVNPDRANINSPNDEVALILFNTSSHTVTFDTELLSGLYNLSPAEANLSLHLCQGLTLDEIAEKFNKSKNTIRSQLRSSFHKMGISRQSELIHLVNTGPAGIIRNR